MDDRQTLMGYLIEKRAADLGRRTVQQMNNIRVSADQGHLLELKYQNKKGTISTRYVEPYKLTDEDFWGYDPDKQSIRRFKVKNIKSVKKTKKPYTPQWPVEVNPVEKTAMATAVQKKYNENQLSPQDERRVFNESRHENPIHDKINSRAKRFEEVGEKATKNMTADKYSRMSKTNNIRYAPAIDSKRIMRYVGDKSNNLINILRKRHGDDAVIVDKNTDEVFKGLTGLNASMDGNGRILPEYKIELPMSTARKNEYLRRIYKPKIAKEIRTQVYAHEILGELASMENTLNALKKRNLPINNETIQFARIGSHADALPMHIDGKVSKLLGPTANKEIGDARNRVPSGFKKGGRAISEAEFVSDWYGRPIRNGRDLAAKSVPELQNLIIRLGNIRKNKHGLSSDQIQDITREIIRKI